MQEFLKSQHPAPMGTTDQGQFWAMKALHPAEPGVSMSGVPDEETVPTVFQNYASSFQVSAPSATVWGFDAYFFPHPYLMGMIQTNAGGITSAEIPIVNTQVGTGIPFVPFNLLCERYRLGYMGVTAYHDASATTNEGTLAAAQYTAVPTPLSIIANMSATVVPNDVAIMGEMWADKPRTFTQLQSMPSAYLGNARDGCYCPYKLSRDFKKWRSTNDYVTYVDYFQATQMGIATYQQGITNVGVGVLDPGSSIVYPYGIPGTHGTTGAGPFTSLVHKRMDSGMIHISARNLDPVASFTFYLRMGVEMQVLPGTTLSPMQMTSPALDQVALDSYAAVSRELRDGYPADYNDLGKILKVIAEVASDVLPMIFPGAGPVMQVAKMVGRRLKIFGTPQVDKPLLPLEAAPRFSVAARRLTPDVPKLETYPKRGRARLRVERRGR